MFYHLSRFFIIAMKQGLGSRGEMVKLMRGGRGCEEDFGGAEGGKLNRAFLFEKVT